MPKIDGLTMLKKLREDPWGKSVNVIVLTNLGDNAKVAEAVQYDVFEYFIKSDWKLEDIVSKVREQLK